LVAEYSMTLDPGDIRDRITTMSCDQLYYDGHCPLCLAEMDRLRELADAELELVDIHTLPDTAGLPEIDSRGLPMEIVYCQV
jgi:predicted DCC family thiol-disulfide oxidoreductase YuxK